MTGILQFDALQPHTEIHKQIYIHVSHVIAVVRHTHITFRMSLGLLGVADNINLCYVRSRRFHGHLL